MLTYKPIFTLLLALLALLFFALIGFGTVPAPAHAGPLPGFTPSPDTGGDDGDSGGNADPRDDDSDTLPTDFILVRLDQCDLACAGDQADASQYQPLAYSIDSAPTVPVLIPIAGQATDFEIIAPVQLVHQGSGFIVDQALSTHRDSRLPVPYAGTWDVFLTDRPRFMTAQAIATGDTNLTHLDTALAQGPIPLGQVEANTEQTQLIECPIECVIDPAPPPDVPATLPETGGISTVLVLTLLAKGLILVIAGLLVHLHPGALNDRSRDTDQPIL